MGEAFEKEFNPQCKHLEWLKEHLDGWQFGEQGIVDALMNALGCKGDCVEVGAGDGESLPITLGKLYHRGFICWLIEIDANRRTMLRERYPCAIVESDINWRACVNATEDGIGCVVIDIDGSDSVVMRDMFAAGVRPTILVVEHFDNHFPIGTSGPASIPQWMLGLKLESGYTIQDTAETLQAIAAQNGYERIGWNRCNSFFVIRERYTDLFRA